MKMKVQDLDTFFDGEFMGWSSGTQAVRVAIEENKDIDNIYMLGFDWERVKLTMYIKIQIVI